MMRKSYCYSSFYPWHARSSQQWINPSTIIGVVPLFQIILLSIIHIASVDEPELI